STFTPFGSRIGFFPTLDIEFALPDLAENLSAYTFFMRVPSGHHPARSRENIDSQTAQHARNVALADVHAATRPRYPLDVRNHRQIIVGILEINLDRFLRTLFGYLEIHDVAFFFQNPRNLGLQLG